jgi:CRISPR-associated protein Cmr3
MNALGHWLIEPRDPLIARDGRPSALGRFETVPFPYPSVIAGAARTRMASPRGAFVCADPRQLLEIPVHGPLLVELQRETNAVASFLAAAPLDAVLYPTPPAAENANREDHPGSIAGRDRSVVLRRLAPRALAAGTTVDTLGERGLALIDYLHPVREKPFHAPPRFWSWAVYERWLESPAEVEVLLSDLGVESLPIERRAHLSMREGERVGEEGALFETAGLRFLSGREGKLAPRQFALAIRAGEGGLPSPGVALREEIAPLGGERRLARWREGTEWPTPAPSLIETIAASGQARLVLLTPAIFAGGALPGWQGGRLPVAGAEDVEVKVRAAIVPRPEVLSGWDLTADNGAGKKRGRPKPTRRLAPAGSVYYLDLQGTPDQIRDWCRHVWLEPVSDAPQDRRDGFGLAALGTWEGLS